MIKEAIKVRQSYLDPQHFLDELKDVDYIETFESLITTANELSYRSELVAQEGLTDIFSGLFSTFKKVFNVFFDQGLSGDSELAYFLNKEKNLVKRIQTRTDYTKVAKKDIPIPTGLHTNYPTLIDGLLFLQKGIKFKEDTTNLKNALIDLEKELNRNGSVSKSLSTLSKVVPSYVKSGVGKVLKKNYKNRKNSFSVFADQFKSMKEFNDVSNNAVTLMTTLLDTAPIKKNYDHISKSVNDIVDIISEDENKINITKKDILVLKNIVEEVSGAFSAYSDLLRTLLEVDHNLVATYKALDQ